MLTPVSLVPKRPTRAAAPLAFLDTIDAVEINRTVERDGVTYFVLDVYLKHYSSRIPTIQMREKQQQQQHHHQFHHENQSHHPAAADDSTSYRMDEPDYQLEKRFSDFADLRYHVWVHAQKQSECQCAYSREFMDFIVYSLAQPRLLVKLATTTSMRKKLFTTFCNEFLRIAVHGGSGRRREVHSDCDVLQIIPTLLERFFRKQDGRSR